MTYATPRSGLEEAGVRSGTVLFKGNYRGERIDGTAYAFKAGCTPAPYDVTGQDNAGNIVLRGPVPCGKSTDVKLLDIRDRLTQTLQPDEFARPDRAGGWIVPLGEERRIISST